MGRPLWWGRLSRTKSWVILGCLLPVFTAAELPAHPRSAAALALAATVALVGGGLGAVLRRPPGGRVDRRGWALAALAALGAAAGAAGLAALGADWGPAAGLLAAASVECAWWGSHAARPRASAA